MTDSPTAPTGSGSASAAEAPSATVYTHGHHESVLRSHTWRTVENSAAYLLSHLRPGTALLDVGCGPGTITVDFAARLPAGRVVGIDRAEAIVRQARATALADAGAGGDAARGGALEFRAADVYDLPFDDGSFDVVHAHQVLQHLGDPVAALVEMRRVCRPGGIVAVRDSDYATMTWYPEEPGLDRWLATYRAVARRNGAEPDAGRHLLAWAHAAGFTDVACSTSSWCYATPEKRAWWGGLWSERVKSSALAGQLVAYQIATPEEIAEISAAWLRWAGEPDGWFAMIHGELLCTA